MSIEDARRKQIREVRALRRPNRARLIQYAFLSALFFAFVTILPGGPKVIIDRSQNKKSLADTVGSSADWLASHGTSLELFLFESGAGFFNNLVQQINDQSIFYILVSSISEASVRVLFIILASMRFWLLCIGWGIFSAFRQFRPYVGDDLLGETGIGKLFYSGINAGLSKVTTEGAPDQLVTNLATLKKVSREKASTSNLARLLKKYEILNETTLELVAHILAFKHVPFFAPSAEEPYPASEQDLVVGTEAYLKDLMEVLLCMQRSREEDLEFESKKLSPPQLEIYRCLAPFQDAVTTVHIAEFGAVLLAIQAGKAMGYLKEGNKWVRRSSFIHLNARSVLHSIPSFKEEFSYLERQRIRQSLVYATRFSTFGPVRLPIDLSAEARTLRQISEYLVRPSVRSDIHADEIELYGLQYRSYKAFEKKWFGIIKQDVGLDPDLSAEAGNIIATEAGIVWVPVKFLVPIFDDVLSGEPRVRFAELTERIALRQKQDQDAKRMDDDGSVKGPLPSYQKVFLPMSAQTLQNVSARLNVTPEVLLHWGMYRNVFNTFGWLSRQVGTTAVPEESCCAVVFRGATWSKEANALGLLGKKGFIPFRSTAFESQIGKNWRRCFLLASSAEVAENDQMYEKLLTGYDPMQDYDE